MGGGACCHSWVAALWFPELEPQSMGQVGGAAPEPGRATAPAGGAARGPGPRLASPTSEGEGVARGQLFTVKGWPFLAGLVILLLAQGGGRGPGRP